MTARPGYPQRMWLSFPTLLFVVLALIGAVIGGGVFTLVLVPVAVLLMLAAIVYSMWMRSSKPGETPQGGRDETALPHSEHRNTAPAPATPDQLVDARQKQ